MLEVGCASVCAWDHARGSGGMRGREVEVFQLKDLLFGTVGLFFGPVFRETTTQRLKGNLLVRRPMKACVARPQLHF